MDHPDGSSPTFTKDSFDRDWIKVGESRFGQVYQVRLKDGQQRRALKVFDSTACADDFHRTLAEAVSVISKVKCKYIVSVYGACDDAPAVLMEYMSNGSLNNLLTSHTLMWPKKFQMIHEASMGMHFLHGLQPPLLHLNLKTSNVLVDGHLHVKISDFGIVQWEEGMTNRLFMELLTARGNVSFIPPETFSQSSERPGTAFDVYSFGIIMWEILAQQKPHAGCCMTSVILSVSHGKRPRVEMIPEPRPRWCDHMVGIMTRCWDRERRKRPEFTDVVRDLEGLCNGVEVIHPNQTDSMDGSQHTADDTHLGSCSDKIPASGTCDLLSDRYDDRDIFLSFLSRKDFGRFRKTVKRDDVLTEFSGGQSLLHFTVASGDEKSIEHVLSLGADVNSATARGYTPLIVAVLERLPEIVSLLLEYGADVSIGDEDQWTPLHFAAQSGDNRTVRLLLDKGATVDACEKGGWMPLHLACQNGHETVARLLLSRLSDQALEAREQGQLRTPLHLASSFGHLDIVKLLLSQGADPNAVDQTLSTALHHSADEGHNRIMRHLVKTGADVKSVNSKGFSALHLAALRGHTGICRHLLSNKACPESKTLQGWTPLHLAAVKGHAATVAELVSQGACVNSGGDNGWTSLHLACHQSHTEVVAKLLQAKADLELTEDDEGWTPLHVACTSLSLPSVLHLIAHDADVNVGSKDKVTPLHIAALSGSTSMVEALLQNGADRDRTDSAGSTPLDVARRAEKWDVVELLAG
ncbi:ankyrin repeat and protein kinase domain-containing protein 1 isoform X1 [Synchiropus splendidus]|uniref:ankyrin repeat and protein kinase domain-containing protein 1 isoform X1 n=2 Tax=Synchiropus splendidus TaxID=270530 RepID=UPI00237DFB11|nr:ankyrin repeat and protein kinase domain-containing protein 1 isoform X1 [Synchiropus splendidus]